MMKRKLRNMEKRIEASELEKSDVELELLDRIEKLEKEVEEVKTQLDFIRKTSAILQESEPMETTAKKPKRTRRAKS